MLTNFGFFPLWFAGKKGNKLNLMKNNIEWCNTFINLANICLSIFEWEGLPDTCNARYMEEALLFDGKCALANDPKLGFINLRCNENQRYNLYGECDKVSLYGMNGYNRQFNCYIMGGDNSNANAVICRDNQLQYPYYLYLIQGAERLTNCMRAIDTSTLQLKRPYFITCEESQKLTVDKILSDIDSNLPAVITTKGINPDSFKVLQTGSNPQVLQELWDSYYKHDNQIRTILGIQNNPAAGKAERLLVDEINSNNEEIDINISLRLQARELFCEQVNEIFGLNISVKIKEGVKNYVDTTKTDIDLQGLEDEAQPME